jgi:hypothetical protein
VSYLLLAHHVSETTLVFEIQGLFLPLGTPEVNFESLLSRQPPMDGEVLQEQPESAQRRCQYLTSLRFHLGQQAPIPSQAGGGVTCDLRHEDFGEQFVAYQCGNVPGGQGVLALKQPDEVLELGRVNS